MALKPTQSDKIRANKSTLDCLRGDGIVKPIKHQLANGNDRYLIVGLGGTGCGALAEVKRTMTDRIDSASLDQHVRFLAIDSSRADLEYMSRKGMLDLGEIYALPQVGARERILTPTPHMRDWLNPSLNDLVRQSTFDGMGAGNRRQFGRVLMTSDAAIVELKARVEECRAQLLGDVPGAAVNLLILAGISGGTGSGAVVDATYIITEILSSGKANWFGQSYGFIILPPASCNIAVPADEHLTSYTNGYAALKEIEHFMTLSYRGERFVMDYDGYKVHQGDLFDRCFLFDGHGNGILNPNPNAVAVRSVASLILHIMSAAQIQSAVDRATARTGDLSSFFLSSPARLDSFISFQSPSHIPRDSHYIFSATGLSECQVPTDLLTVYAVKKMFDSMYEMYRQGSDADSDAARLFLSELGFTPSDLLEQLNRQFTKANPGLFANSSQVAAAVEDARKEVTDSLEKRFDAKVDGLFTSKGPYYLINLMLHVSQLLSGQGRVSVGGSGQRALKENAVRNIFQHFTQLASETNRATWEVYCTVIDELKRVLDKTKYAFTEPIAHRMGHIDNHIWTPITTVDSAGLGWIDNVMTPERTACLVTAFQQVLIDQKDEWLKHDDLRDFDAAGVVRSFVESNFQDILHLDIQDFLAKCYSGDLDVVGLEADGVTPTPALRGAAEAIAHTLMRAGLLAQVRSMEKYERAPVHQVLIVPAETPQLNQLLAREISGAAVGPLSVYMVSRGQSFTFLTDRFGLSLGDFSWVAEGEKAYAESQDRVGLHLCEGNTNWRGLPNLINSALWAEIAPGYTFCEEEIMAQHVRGMLDIAKQFGIVSDFDVAGTQYHLFLLDDSDGRVLEKAVVPFFVCNDVVVQDPSSAGVYEGEAESLFALLDKGQVLDVDRLRDALPSGVFYRHSTKPLDMLMNDGNKPRPGFEWEYTSKFLRKMYRTCISLERTLGVMTKLREKVAENNQRLESRKGSTGYDRKMGCKPNSEFTQ